MNGKEKKKKRKVSSTARLPLLPFLSHYYPAPICRIWQGQPMEGEKEKRERGQRVKSCRSSPRSSSSRMCATGSSAHTRPTHAHPRARREKAGKGKKGKKKKEEAAIRADVAPQRAHDRAPASAGIDKRRKEKGGRKVSPSAMMCVNSDRDSEGRS